MVLERISIWVEQAGALPFRPRGIAPRGEGCVFFSVAALHPGRVFEGLVVIHNLPESHVVEKLQNPEM